MGRTCAVNFCQSTQGSSGLFVLPQNEKIRKKWLLSNPVGWKSTKLIHVCMDHFTEDSFHTDHGVAFVRRRLKLGSVPSIFPKKERAEQIVVGDKEDIISQKVSEHKASRYIARKFPCKHCDYFAGQVSDLKRHLEYKHLGIRYHCDLCEHSSSRIYDLKMHKLKKHGTRSPKENNSNKFRYPEHDLAAESVLVNYEPEPDFATEPVFVKFEPDLATESVLVKFESEPDLVNCKPEPDFATEPVLVKFEPEPDFATEPVLVKFEPKPHLATEPVLVKFEPEPDLATEPVLLKFEPEPVFASDSFLVKYEPESEEDDIKEEDPLAGY